MSYNFDFGKFKKHNPADIRNMVADDYDFEYADEFDYMFDDFEDFDDDSEF